MKIYILIIISLVSLQLTAQSFEDYVLLAIKNNPTVKAAIVEVKIAGEKMNEVGTWKDTGLSIGAYPFTPETRVGSQKVNFGVSQELPWFGTLHQEKRVQQEKQKLKEWEVDLTSKQLRYKLAELYYKLYQLQANIKILKEDENILNIYEKMALGALENNRAKMSEVLSIRVEKNEINSRIIQLQKELVSFKHVFLRLANLPLNDDINLPEELNIEKIYADKSKIDSHPSIKKIAQWEEVFKQEKKLIKKRSKPKFKLGTTYIPVTPRTDAFPADNGKDVWMLSIGLKLPLFNRSYKSELKQTNLKIKKIKYQKENQRLNLESALEQALTDYNNAKLGYSVAKQNIIEIQRAINADLKAYETALLDYDKILRLQLQKIKVELRAVDYLKKAFIAVEKINFLLK